MKQWEMGRSQTPLPPERRAEVPWLFIRQQTGTGVLVCCTIPTSSRPLSENDEAEIKSARERLARLHESGDLPAGAAWFWPRSDRSRSAQSPDGYRRRLRGIGCSRCGCAERMSETATLEFIRRRLDGLQNNVSGLNRRMITLESNLIDRVGALEARMAELEDCVDNLAERIGMLETGVNSLVLLVERIAKAQGLAIEMILRSPLE